MDKHRSKIRLQKEFILKVLQVTGSISPKRGGPSFAIWGICEALQLQGIEVHILTTDDDGPDARLAVPNGQFVVERNIPVIYFPRQTSFYAASLPLVAWLYKHIHEYDLIHTHALFTFVPVASATVARYAGVPYVMRPLGTLNRWGREQQRPTVKKSSIKFIEGPLLRSAAAVHFTADEELTEAKELCIQMNPFIQPLGFNLQKLAPQVSPELFYEQHPSLRGKTIILFLSRIDRKKGLEILLQSFQQIVKVHPEAVLVIGGNGDDAYGKSLQLQARQMGIDVVWLGFVTGDFKASVWRAASIFVLPSYSENFGIAVVEALAAAKPVIISNEIAIHPTITDAEAGLVVPAGDVQALTQALTTLLQDEPLRNKLATNGYQLAHQRYSLENLGQSLQHLYATIVEKSHPNVQV